MNWHHREPTLDEILSDSIVRAVMEVDGVNPHGWHSVSGPLDVAMKVPKTTEEISALSCNPQISDDFPSVHALDVGTEKVDQFFGLHFVFSCEITALNSLSPRCTFVLMADSEMPQRAAASTTLSPSIFTYWIANRTLSGSLARSLFRSKLLSVAGSPSAAMISLPQMIDQFVTSDSIYPWRQKLGRIVRVASRVYGHERFLSQILTVESRGLM